MIVYNTTFHMNDADVDEFLDWLRHYYVPSALSGGIVTNPQLHRIMGHRGLDDGGVSYALQVQAPSLGDLQRWHLATGKQLMQGMMSRFGTRVVAFATMMEKIEI